MTPTVKQLRHAGYKVRVMHYRHTPSDKDPISIYWIKAESRHNDLRTVLPYGGITVVTIGLPMSDETADEFEGVAECSRKEQFAYKFGVNIAVGRAIQKIEKAGYKLKL